LIPFLTAGYPDLDASLAIAQALAGRARALEIGIPFSDPIADGADIQRASEWALSRGVGARETLELVRRLRRSSETPVVLMTYTNPVLRGGIENFAAAARDAGADGVLLTDLPADEAPEIWGALEGAGLDTVMLVAPTTAEERLPTVLSRARGFLYCLSRTGVTGPSPGFSGPLAERVASLRRATTLPIAVGFGIARADQAAALRGVADAIVVGAAFMRAIAADPHRGTVERVVTLAEELVAALERP
jgi:tryptophan synthase alpha chain